MWCFDEPTGYFFQLNLRPRPVPSKPSEQLAIAWGLAYLRKRAAK